MARSPSFFALYSLSQERAVVGSGTGRGAVVVAEEKERIKTLMLGPSGRSSTGHGGKPFANVHFTVTQDKGSNL